MLKIEKFTEVCMTGVCIIPPVIQMAAILEKGLLSAGQRYKLIYL